MNSLEIDNAPTSAVPKWIDYALLLTLFINGITLFTTPFEFYIGYFVIIVLIQKYLRVYSFPNTLFWAYLVLLIAGVLSLFTGQNQISQFLKIYLGTFMAYLFYYYILERYEWNVKYLFQLYLKGVWWATIIGLLQFVSYLIDFKYGYDFKYIFNKWGIVPGGFFGLRINSIFGEPTYYATFMAGGAFVALHNLIGGEYYYSKFKSAVILVVYFLTFSGNATTGLFISLALLIFNRGFLKYSFVLIPLGFLAFNYNYETNFEFRDRFDSSLEVFQTENFEIGSTHGSSIILFNNYHVAMKSFQENPLFGGGLGSHPISFEKYSLTKNVGVSGFDWNSQDANSMFLRLVSETGLFGVVLFLWILIKFYVFRKDSKDDYWLISNAILVIILLNFIRQGHYFLHGFPFYVWMYYYNYRQKRNSIETQVDEIDTELNHDIQLNVR
ncbi:MAG: hypothetical protein CL840_05950 [Crocinitomicaceae bacterium]|nr:hypothetical protein [Crocinitomicaceae bacterium]|tara:strand:+ start:3788 stop:5110 length:1323 start_codon:yes stop_codon:yes gene_type:complete